MQQIEDNMRTLRRVMTTRYPIAQTPKEVIWTLNKAKLYRYVPVVPEEQRHKRAVKADAPMLIGIDDGVAAGVHWASGRGTAERESGQ